MLDLFNLLNLCSNTNASLTTVATTDALPTTAATTDALPTTINLQKIINARAELQRRPRRKSQKQELDPMEELIRRWERQEPTQEHPQLRASNIQVLREWQESMKSARKARIEKDRKFISFITSLSNEINSFIPQIKEDQSFDILRIVAKMNDKLNSKINESKPSATPIQPSTTPIRNEHIYNRLQEYDKVLDIIKNQEQIIDKQEVATLIVDYTKAIFLQYTKHDDNTESIMSQETAIDYVIKEFMSSIKQKTSTQSTPLNQPNGVLGNPSSSRRTIHSL